MVKRKEPGFEMLKGLLKKYLNRETITYVATGIGTTIVNYIVYYLCRFAGVPYEFANVIAWCFAVAFAYVTNKLWVFQSRKSTKVGLFKEISLFVSARVASLLIEEAFLIFTVEVLGASDTVMKLVAAVFVIVANYVISKLLIFKKENDINEKIENQ